MEINLTAIYFDNDTIRILNKIDKRMWFEIEQMIDNGYFNFVGEGFIQRDGNFNLKRIYVPKEIKKKDKPLDRLA